jgi:hypothetical protein
MHRTFAAALRRSIATPTVAAAHAGKVAPAPAACPDPRIDEALKLLLAVGAVLVLLLPAARGSVASIGWLPMWLLGMPLVALWALRGFALPSGCRASVPVHERPRRARSVPQARRRARPATAPVRARAA